LADPDVKQKLLVQGLEAHGSTAAEFGEFVDGRRGSGTR
jgi:hypothetical protein